MKLKVLAFFTGILFLFNSLTNAQGRNTYFKLGESDASKRSVTFIYNSGPVSAEQYFVKASALKKNQQFKTDICL